MTDEQIELEWQHYLLDHPDLAKQEVFSDPSYDEWVAQAEEEDRKLSFKDEVKTNPDEIISRIKQGKALDSQNNDDWEEVPLSE